MPKSNYGTYFAANNSWSGTLGMIDRGEVDTMCPFMQKSELRVRHFDFPTKVFNVGFRCANFLIFGEVSPFRYARASPSVAVTHP